MRSPRYATVTTALRQVSRSGRTPGFICQSCLSDQPQRSLHGSASSSSVPQPTPFVPDVPTFLSLIGREMSQHASKFESWKALFSLSSPQLKDLGIEPARSRRYLLRWRQKFKDGQFGIGGDLSFVQDGKAELRILQVPATNGRVSMNINGPPPGFTKLVLNVPSDLPDEDAIEELIKRQGLSADQLRKPTGYKMVDQRFIVGPHFEVTKGSNGARGVIKIKEGMWEHKRGKKIDGGERRRKEVRHKRAVAEHRKNS